MTQKLVASLVNESTGEVSGRLEIPTSPAHVLFEKFSTLEATATRINNYIVGVHKKQKKEASKKKVDVEDVPFRFKRSRYLGMIREGIKDYFSLDKETVKQIVSGDLDNHMKNYKEWTPGELPKLTLIGLYEYLYTVILKYKPKVFEDGKDHSYIVGEETYVIKAFVRDAVINKVRNPVLNVQEVTEALVIEEEYNKYKKGVTDEELKERSGKPIKGYQFKALIDFQKNLKKIAILSRKPEEGLPTDENKFEEWLDNRYKAIAKINMRDALDSLFFLSGITRDLEKIRSINGFTLKFHPTGS